MSDGRADCLSPIDVATLWPQLPRLAYEVVAPHGGESLLLRSGIAATGLSRLPRLPRTVVLGVRRGLSYRGVLVARELTGGAAWEVVSLRLPRPGGADAVTDLLGATADEVARRSGRLLVMRFPEESAERDALRRGGMMPYTRELLFALPERPRDRADWVFRQARGSDRHASFRLYCRVVPEQVRRNEAATLAEWRAVLASYDCDQEHVLDGETGVLAWVGTGRDETRILLETQVEGALDAALDLAERAGSGRGSLVIPEYQYDLQRRADERGYPLVGARIVASRRLALLQPLKEVVAVPADPFAVPQ